MSLLYFRFIFQTERKHLPGPDLEQHNRKYLSRGDYVVILLESTREQLRLQRTCVPFSSGPTNSQAAVMSSSSGKLRASSHISNSRLLVPRRGYNATSISTNANLLHRSGVTLESYAFFAVRRQILNSWQRTISIRSAFDPSRIQRGACTTFPLSTPLPAQSFVVHYLS